MAGAGWGKERNVPLLACLPACLLLLLLLLPHMSSQFPFPSASQLFCDHHLSDQTALNTTATYVRNCSINPAPRLDTALHILSLLAGCLPALHDASPGGKGAGDQFWAGLGPGTGRRGVGLQPESWNRTH